MSVYLNLDRSERPRRGPLADGLPLPPDFDIAPKPAAPWSLASLYREHRAKLRSFFKGRGAAATADDLVQEAFAKLAETDERGPGRIDRPEAYINRIAHNLLHEQARFAARRSAALHVSIDDVEVAGSDPVAQLEARDMLVRLEAAMARMKPATREIFMAHRIDGCSYREIADATGFSMKQVERHMSKAIFLINRAMRQS